MNPTSIRLSQAMQEENISTENLSASTGIPQEKIQSYLNNTHLLGMGEAVRLGKALHVNWTWLMGYGED